MRDRLTKRIDPSAYRALKMSSADAVRSSKYESIPLKEVAIFTKRTITEPLELPYMGLENIEANTGFYIPSPVEKESFSSALEFETGEILFPKLAPYLNKVHLAEFDGVCSTEFQTLKVKNLNTLYLFSFLRSKIVVNQTICLMTGSLLPRLGTKDIQQLYIPLPPVDIQNRIAVEVKKRLAKVSELRNEAEVIVEAAKKRVEQILFDSKEAAGRVSPESKDSTVVDDVSETT